MNVPAECCTKTKASKVKVTERGRKCTILNSSRQQLVRIQMDGCCIKNSTAADWVISKIGVGDIIIELKGRNVEHAVHQVITTAEGLTTSNLRQGALIGIIVCQQVPKVSTRIQRAQQAFRKKFHNKLYVHTKDPQACFDKLIG